jgi:flagellar basal body rod protein FlgG
MKTDFSDDNTANNLANASTAGFYGRRLQLSDFVYQNVVMPGAAATQQTTVASDGLLCWHELAGKTVEMVDL